MSTLAIVLRACVMLGIHEPMQFFDLSPAAQDLWLEYACHDFSGAWLAAPAKVRGAQASAAAIEREAIERAAAKEAKHGPR